MDKIAVTTPGAQLAGFHGPRGAMRVGPGVSVPVFAVPGKQNPTWVRIRPNNEGYPPHLTQLSGADERGADTWAARSPKGGSGNPTDRVLGQMAGRRKILVLLHRPRGASRRTWPLNHRNLGNRRKLHALTGSYPAHETRNGPVAR